MSGPELVIAACRAGVIGAFPTANAGGADGLDAWLARIMAALGPGDAPCCPNIIIHRPPLALAQDIAAVRRHRVELVITSVGSPAPVIAPLHEAGCLVFADVGTLAHAKKAVQAGADGLVLLSAGAGGQTGWLNGLAFVRAVRGFFDGPVVLAGGISDGAALWAAQALGCDLAYMGTKFIATQESLAAPGYKQMVVEAEIDDVQLTRAFSGLRASMLRPSIVAAGLDPDALDEQITPERARELFGASRDKFAQPGASRFGPKRWQDVWSAGHSVSGVGALLSVDQLVETTRQEYRDAMRHSLALIQDAAADEGGLA
ncbi:MAG: nitronate monooxygenase [Sulfuricaulis sp.]|nr:nitronate monooxygenase [Sulfuricaulis sp.]